MLDGVISCAAALLAVRLCPQSVHFMVAAHRSDEPASILLLDALGKRPFLTAGMHLGEGQARRPAWRFWTWHWRHIGKW